MTETTPQTTTATPGRARPRTGTGPTNTGMNTCLRHCRHLMLRSASERVGQCLADPLSCRRFRERAPEDCNEERDRLTVRALLDDLFDTDDIADGLDLVTLIAAVHRDDQQAIDALLYPLLPAVDWVRRDNIGIGSDWSGVKVALVCAVEHPRLRAAVGLTFGIGDVRLTLGQIDHVDPALLTAPRPLGTRARH